VFYYFLEVIEGEGLKFDKLKIDENNPTDEDLCKMLKTILKECRKLLPNAAIVLNSGLKTTRYRVLVDTPSNTDEPCVFNLVKIKKTLCEYDSRYDF